MSSPRPRRRQCSFRGQATGVKSALSNARFVDVVSSSLLCPTLTASRGRRPFTPRKPAARRRPNWDVLAARYEDRKGKPVASDTVDLVGRVDLGLLPPGVEVRPGICDQRPAWLDADGTPMFLGPDTAYGISRGANLSVSTAEAFLYGFPRDFSLLATFRMQQNTRGYLLTVYDWDDEEQMTLHVGENLTFALRSDSSNTSIVYSAVFTEPFNDGKQVFLSVLLREVHFVKHH
ncbi:hypothetical protein HPB50_001808 [Hyalomma asiaticum]|uniref:Uncharacterized protein n=1 Tax=Hyalomma asiaticum TaxID=266040 RepID=A0ACB7TCP6_HYAAI|nr:hypothetical protein HPB50_001808 [Hyalomma asiaticum]